MLYNNRSRTFIAFSLFCVCATILPNEILAQSYSTNKCTTPRGEEGECILIPQCQSIISLLQSRPSPEGVEYVRKSGCGFEGFDPKVCCPLKVQAQTTSTTTTLPPSSNAGNLLPDINKCGPLIERRIVGGDEAELRDFPWMALLEYQTRSGKGFYCGGVLINRRYVLTAAHCVKGKDLPTTWRLVSVRLGEYNTSSEIDCAVVLGQTDCAPKPVDVAIESQIAHEDYDPFDINQYHDVALLRLSENVDYTDEVRPICLPSGQQLNETFAGQTMDVAGWGKTETKSASEVIMKLMIKVRKNSECAPTYKAVRVNLGDGQMCAGGLKGQDSCRGDSGGPLMGVLSVDRSQNYYALGVVSFGPSPCGLQGWPGIYTRITKYMPWIISNLRP